MKEQDLSGLHILSQNINSTLEENKNSDIKNENPNQFDTSNEIYKDTGNNDNNEIESDQQLIKENNEEDYTVENALDEENKNLE